jgi:hypothetical protein
MHKDSDILIFFKMKVCEYWQKTGNFIRTIPTRKDNKDKNAFHVSTI